MRISARTSLEFDLDELAIASAASPSIYLTMVLWNAATFQRPSCLAGTRTWWGGKAVPSGARHDARLHQLGRLVEILVACEVDRCLPVSIAPSCISAVG